jgi:hypothetical protein
LLKGRIAGALRCEAMFYSKSEERQAALGRVAEAVVVQCRQWS